MWVVFPHFIFIETCLFKTFKKYILMKNSIILLSRRFKCNIFVNSFLNFVSLKPLQFLYSVFSNFGLLLKNVRYFITVTMSLWKSERTVSKTEDFWKQFILLVKNRSIHDGFERFWSRLFDNISCMLYFAERWHIADIGFSNLNVTTSY